MDDRTISGALLAALTQAPETERIRFVGQQGYTPQQMLDRAALAAGLMDSVGVAKGDRVALMMSNRVEFLDVWFAAAHLGAISVPLNTSLKGPILEHMLRDSQPDLVVVEAEFLEVVGTALNNIGLAPRLLVIDAHTGQGDFGAYDYAAALGHAIPVPMADVSQYDDACVLYTSGTTGPSKGVLHTHASVIAFGEQAQWLFGYTAEDVAHNCLPLFHSNALCCTLLPGLRAGATVVFGRRFSARGFWDEVRSEGATVISILGAMVPILWGAQPSTTDADNRVRAALSVPTPSADIYHEFEQRFGLRLISLYGSTDVSPTIGTPPSVVARPGYAGVAHPNFEFEVVDEHDEPVPDGTAGELLIRSRKPHTMMSAYWNNPAATAETWRNLWFHTGDLLVREPDGWFRFIDRKKDAIRRFGENISSFEVESVIAAHPCVDEAAVFPVPSDLAEDEVMAAIVLQPGADVSMVDIETWCDQNLPYFAVPRYLRVMTELPKTKNEKVLKESLRRDGVTADAVDRGPRGRTSASRARVGA